MNKSKLKTGLLILVLVGVFSFTAASYTGVFRTSSILTDDPYQSDEKYTIESNATEDFPIFKDASIDSGLQHRYDDQPEQGKWFADIGSNEGVYVVDYNSDGWDDIMTLGGQPAIYKNNKGEFKKSQKFPNLKDIVPARIKSAHFFDYDNDNDPDLLLGAVDKPPLLYENKNGEFVRVEAGFEKPLDNPETIASADYNNDGCLDIYVGQYGTNREIGQELSDDEVSTYSRAAEPNQLYKGDCEGFTRVTDEVINRDSAGWTFAVSFVDLTDDGYADLHIANDFGHDYLLVNNGDGTFERRQMTSSTNRNAMASEVADFNNDGKPDLFVTNIYVGENMSIESDSYISDNPKGNNLLINKGDGEFVDKAKKYGVQNGGWGWSATVVDLNNDGDFDIVHATSLKLPIKGYKQNELTHPQTFAGSEDGTFTKVSPSKHGFEATNGRGVARLDYDHDGDMDIVIATTPVTLYTTQNIEDSSLKLYENKLPDNNNFIQFRLNNPDGLETGSVVTLKTNKGTEMRWLTSEAGFISQETKVLHYGLDDGEKVEKVTVEWQNGKTKTYTAIKKGNRYILTPDTVKKDSTVD